MASSCGLEAVAREEFTLDATPDLSTTIAGPDEAGNVDVTLAWQFKYTADATNRIISRQLQLPGNLVSAHTLTGVAKEGSFTFQHNVSCWAPGTWNVTGYAETCNGTRQTEGTVTTNAIPPVVMLTLRRIGIGDSTQRPLFEGRIVYDMQRATGNWQLRADMMRFIDNAGGVHPGSEVLLPHVPTERSGIRVFTFLAPVDAQQVFVRATASSCYGTAVSDDAIDCPDCTASSSGPPGWPTGGRAGGGAPPLASADPVYFNDGNMRLADVDPLPSIAGTGLSRTYNSHEQVSGLFGRGWTSLFDRRATIHAEANGETVVLTTATNELVIFRRAGAGGFVQTFPIGRSGTGVLTWDPGTAEYLYRAPGETSVAAFRASDGRLTALRTLGTGREARIAYDASGQPVSLTDSWTSTTWLLTVDAQRRIQAIEVAGRPDLAWTYTYDPAGNLTSVFAPGPAVWRTYDYVANRMTASHDALGNLIESHAYDLHGRATNSTGRTDEIAQIEYAIASSRPDETITRVTQKSGAVTDYVLRPAGGAWRTVQVINGCGSCGARNATYAYDHRGRVVRVQEADGYISRSVYSGDRVVASEGPLKPAGCDPRTSANRCRLDTDGLAAVTLEATEGTVLTEYAYEDARWPDRPTRISTPSVASPGRIRKRFAAYDPDSGMVIGSTLDGYAGSEPAHSERGSNTTLYRAQSPREDEDGGTTGLEPAFSPGGSFNSAWLALPQPALLPKSVDGPRTDAQDVTSYVYYPLAESVPALLRGRLAATRNAAGHVTRFEGYDVFGNVTRTVDPTGVVNEATFDLLGRLKSSTIKGIPGCDTASDPLCATDLTTTRTYSPAAGPLSSEARAGGGVTVHSYDSRGRVQTISRGPSIADLRERVEYGYDPLTGKKSLERFLAFRNGAWTETRSEAYGYNGLGELVTVTHADGKSLAYTYDETGRIETVRDENHTTPNTKYVYDSDGHIETVEQTLAGAPNGRITTRYAYDLDGNLTSVIDPNGNETRYVYDDFGALITQESPVTGRTENVYDEASNLLRVVDANGIVTRRTFDVLGRITRAEAGPPDAGGGGGGGRIEAVAAAPEVVTWVYDDPSAGAFGIGRLASMTDPTGTTAYRYERRGALARETKQVKGTAFLTSFAYDADGNRSRIHYPSGRLVTYQFDYAGRPTSAVTGTTTLVASTAYLPFGPATEIVYGNGTTKRMPHDARYRPLANELVTAERTLASYDYTHDPAGNITRIGDLTDSTYTRTFAYDDLNRLTTATGSWGSATHSYDRMGNMLRVSRGEQVTAFSYQGSTPKLASVSDDGRTQRAVSYDAAGNERQVGTSSYGYTARNHVGAIGANTYLYDGRGIRTVTSRPAEIASFVVSPGSVQGGGSVTLTVTLSAAAPATGAVVSLTSSGSFAPLPASISVPGGVTSATLTIQTQTVSGSRIATLAASFNGSTRTTSLSVFGSRFDALTVQPSSVVGGSEALGTVSLNEEAPEEGLNIAITSSDESARVPAQLLIPGGQGRGQFRVATTPVREPVLVTIATSTGEETTEAALTIMPPSVALIAFTPPAVYGGAIAQGTVTLTGPAPEGGVSLSLRSNSASVTVPDAVLVPAGALAASFPVTAVPVESPQTVSIAVILGETERRATLRIDPPLLADFTVTPGRIESGQTAIAEATLNAPAAATGAVVELTNTHPQIVSSPAQLIVSGGETKASAQMPTGPVAETTPVVLSAARNGVTRSSTLIVEPPAVTLASVALTPPSVTGSNDVALILTLSGPAPQTGLEIELVSSDPAVLVPPIAIVPAGGSQTTVPVATAVVQTTVTATISATHSVTTKTVALTVLPPAGNYVASLAASPVFVTPGVAATGSVSLAMPSNDVTGTDVSLTSSAPGLLTVPPFVTVKRHQSSETFAISLGTITAAARVTISATYGGVTQRTTVVVAPVNSIVPTSLIVSPARVTGGTPASAVVTLNGAAPAGGAVIALTARRRNILTMPSSVIVPEGASAATFTVATEPVHGNARVAEIDATYNGITVTTTLTVDPSPRVATATRAVALCASAALEPCLTRAAFETVVSSTTLYEQRFTLYSPELTLFAETGPTIGQTHTVAYEYVWYAGQPLAQINGATGVIDWYFNDHLGTPVLQTDANARIVWQPEYDVYGGVLGFRRGEAKHQPLRFPGQTAEAGTDLSYNVFRWYRAGWGRYTQADRAGVLASLNLYAYVNGNSLRWTDPKGLYRVEPPNGPRSEEINRAIFDLYRRIDARRPCCDADTAQRLMDFLSSPTLIFEYDASLPICATISEETIEGAEERIIVGGAMWTPACKCSLASVILHEMAHAAFMDRGEAGPDAIQLQCYGCQQPRGGQ